MSAYDTGDIAPALHGGHDVIVIAQVVRGVYLAAALTGADNPGVPGTATGSYYLPETDAYVIPTLVRTYQENDLGTITGNACHSEALDLTQTLYRAALGGTR